MNSAKVSGPITGGNQSLSLLGLLQFLWNAAGLNEWRPQFAGRRNWAIVRSRLLHAAARMSTEEGPLLDHLFIPEAFSIARSEVIRARRHDIWRSTTAKLEGNDRLLMMIAEVKDVRPCKTGGVAVMKHLPDCIFKLNAASFSALKASFTSIPPWPSQDHRKLVLIATFAPTLQGDSSMFLIAHEPVSTDWVAH